MSERLIYKLLETEKTVFSLNEIAMLVNAKETSNLKSQLHYYVKTGLLLNIRRGFYAKQKYNVEEFVCKLYTPTYISLDYVLQKEFINFQYNSKFSAISYLSREVTVENNTISYRKLKNSALINTLGIHRLDNGINIASAERAVMDSLYLNKSGYFDNITKLNIDLMRKMIPIYQSKSLENLFKKTF